MLTPRRATAGGEYTLGRAFLQAAFVGVNWEPDVGLWFLAQAPGPVGFPLSCITSGLALYAAI